LAGDDVRHIGFAGTREGMSPKQHRSVFRLLTEMEDGNLTGHHGDCVGSDEDFHDLCKIQIGMPVEGHPSTHHLRAYCKVDVEHAVADTAVRNLAIVTAADIMIATPLEMVEQQRGGTWQTIRMARKAGKPLYLGLRDGTVKKERVE
jgi:hypothetical protein